MTTRRMAVLAASIAFVTAFVVSFFIVRANADADSVPTYGSGASGGKVGSQVLSTKAYTAISDWMIAGDSITVRGYKDLAATKPGKRLAVNAWSGRNTQETVDQIVNPSITPYLPPVLIMAVGTNDIFSPFGMPLQVKRLLDYVHDHFPDTQVFWVDVQASRPGFSVADQRNSMMVNKAIWQGCTEQAHCTVISWSLFLAANPSRFTMYIDKGGVHPIIGVGTKAWAAVVGGPVQP